MSESILYSEGFYPKDWTCKKCGVKLSVWDLEANDYLCPICKTDLWGPGKLDSIPKATQEVDRAR